MKPPQALRRRARSHARRIRCGVSNRQRRVKVEVSGLRRFVRALHSQLRLGQRWFEVTLVGSREMARLNRTFRSKPHPTDVLSFPWHLNHSAGEIGVPKQDPLRGFLGDIVISAEIARRNAAQEGHSPEIELRQLILHGALHLLGYDHENDRGEMAALELSLRRELKIDRDSVHCTSFIGK